MNLSSPTFKGGGKAPRDVGTHNKDHMPASTSHMSVVQIARVTDRQQTLFSRVVYHYSVLVYLCDVIGINQMSLFQEVAFRGLGRGFKEFGKK